MTTNLQLSFGSWQQEAEPLEYLTERHLIPDEGWHSPTAVKYKVGDRNATRHHSLQYEIAGEADQVVYIGVSSHFRARLQAHLSGWGAQFLKFAPPTRILELECLQGEEYRKRGSKYLDVETEWGKRYLEYDQSTCGIHINDISTYAFWQA